MPIGGSLAGGGQGVGGGTGLHAFDTGFREPQRTLVRRHVIARLQALLKTSPNGYVHRIKPLPRPLRNLDGEDLEQVVKGLGGQSPSLLVALGDKTYASDEIDGSCAVGDLEVCVYALSSHQRSFIEGRLEQDSLAKSSAGNDPGIETMLEHVEELLLGQRIDLAGTKELRPQSEGQVATDPTHTLWEQRYVVRVMRDIRPSRDAGGPVTNVQTFHQSVDEETDPLDIGAFDVEDLDEAPKTIVRTATDLEVPEP